MQYPIVTKLETAVFWEFLQFFSSDPLKLCQVGWGALLHRNSQVCPEMFDRVQVGALAGPLENIQRLVPKPLLCCLGCVLRVVVLSEGEPSSQSEVLSNLLHSSFPRSWLNFQSLPLKKIPKTWFCHHHASLQGWCQVSSRCDAFMPKS
jgi:hypothetical protein